MRAGYALWISLLVAAVVGAGASAGAVDVVMSVSEGGATVCDGFDAGVELCDAAGLAGANITVTFHLSSPEVLYGYELNLQWDPSELTLVEWEQLLPDSYHTPFDWWIEPDPAHPEGCVVFVGEPVALQTTALFSLTFEVATRLPADCLPDVSWWASSSAFSPPSVVLENPEGAGIDLGGNRACSDGIDNDGDGGIDFDGGWCAGLQPAAEPDPQCGSAIRGTEAKSRGCGLGLELVLALAGLGWWSQLRRRPRRV